MSTLSPYPSPFTRDMPDVNVDTIAAYFFLIWDEESDPNRPITDEEREFHKDSAERFIKAVNDMLINLPLFDKTESDIQYYMYEVGKKYFGITQYALNFWFKCLYTMFFGTKTGPRIGTFIYIFGVDEFLQRLKERMIDPLDVGAKKC